MARQLCKKIWLIAVQITSLVVSAGKTRMDRYRGNMPRRSGLPMAFGREMRMWAITACAIKLIVLLPLYDYY